MYNGPMFPNYSLFIFYVGSVKHTAQLLALAKPFTPFALYTLNCPYSSPAVHFHCKHLYIPSLQLNLPVSHGQMSILAPRVVCLSSLIHSFTSPLLHYLLVRVNKGMSEGANVLKCATEQKKKNSFCQSSKHGAKP